MSGHILFQLVAVLVVQKVWMAALFGHVPLRQAQYFEPVLTTQLVRGGGLRLLAPWLIGAAFARWHRRLRASLPGSPSFGSAVVALAGLASVLAAFAMSPLPYPQFLEPVLVASVLKEDAATLLVVLTSIAVVPSLRATSWRRLDPRGRARLFVLVSAGILVWAFVTYDDNLYYGQAYDLDRAVLIVALAALAVHPAALPALLVVLMALAAQAHFPLPEGRWMWPDKLLPLMVLVVFQAFVLVRAVLRDRVRPALLPVALLCCVGAIYGRAAVNKLMLGPSPFTWVLDNDLSDLLMSAHVQIGWPDGVSTEGVLRMRRVLHGLHVPLAVATIAVEIAGFFLLTRWRLTRVLLVGFACLHAAILLCSGIFFWKWIVVDLALLAYLALLRRDAGAAKGEATVPAEGYGRWLKIVAPVVMLAGPLYLHDAGFAWFDTKLVSRFEVHAVGESGARYPVHPRFFAPYEMVMEQSRHGYAFDQPVLTGTFGTTMSWETRSILRDARPEDARAIAERQGRTDYSPEGAETFAMFVRRYVEEAERRGERVSWRSALAPPFHFRSAVPDDRFDLQEPVRAIEIRFVETLHTDEGLHRTRDVVVRTIDLAPRPR